MRFFSTAITLAAITAAVLGATINVDVGAGGKLAYNPSNISAAVGDTIEFQFQAKNHSVTQSTFTSPCTRAMFNSMPGANSGFLSLPPNATNTTSAPPTWTITINATTPLWFYCAQTNPVSHCQKGMVFSINATPQKTFDMFLATAMASGANATNATDATPTAAGNGTLASAATATGNGTSSPVAAAAGNGTTTSVSAATGNGTSALASASQAASNQSPNGASKLMSTRGAAGLLTVVTIGAMLF